MSGPVLELLGVSKAFGGTPIIRGVDLSLSLGERRALIGPNGAGKSTLFNLISGAHRADHGHIRLDGTDITHLAPYRINRLGLSRSFQISAFFPRMSVFENLRISILAARRIRFGLFRMAGRALAINRETETLMETMRLADVRDRPAGDLTYGEQRALEIGLALGTGGSIILLDEPTAGMSGEETQYMVDLIRDVTKGRTLLIIEHDMDVVFSLSDSISVMVRGEVIATDTPLAIRANEHVRSAYLGEH